MKWLIIILIASVVLAVGCMTQYCTFRYSSVCSRSGAVQRTKEWQIPNTMTPAFSRSSMRQTPVSLCLTTNKIVPPHNHQWVFAQGGGHGVRCALGSAHMVRSTVESTNVAQLLEALEHYGEHSFRDKVLTNLFDDSATFAVRTLYPPEGGFTNATQLHEWISEQSEYFDEMITAFKGR